MKEAQCKGDWHNQHFLCELWQEYEMRYRTYTPRKIYYDLHHEITSDRTTTQNKPRSEDVGFKTFAIFTYKYIYII